MPDSVVEFVARWKPVVWAVAGVILFMGARLGFSVITPQDEVARLKIEHAQIQPALERMDNRLQDMSEIVCLFVIQDDGPRDQGDQAQYIRQRCNRLMATDNTRAADRR